MKKKKIHAHEQVVKVAISMAHELYAEVMRQDNTLYAEWKATCSELTPEVAERMFVQLMFPKLLEPARATLAKMLANPAHAALHESIYDSIILDNAVRAGRLRDESRQMLSVDEEGKVKTSRSPLQHD